MQSNATQAVVTGQDRTATIYHLVDIISQLAGVCLLEKHVDDTDGMCGRNSDNTRLLEVLGWEPEVGPEDGLARTYAWIEAQVRAQLQLGPLAQAA